MSLSHVHSPSESLDDALPNQVGSGAGIEELARRLVQPGPIEVVGLAGAARGQVAAQLLARGLGPLVAVAADEEAADLLEKDLRFFLGTSSEQGDSPTVLRLPSA